ncbi:hypothetical protein CIK76_06595, partial [Glutamicibacter sp. BW80]
MPQPITFENFFGEHMNLQPQPTTSLPDNQNPRLHGGKTLFIDGSFGPASSAATRQIFCPANGE